MYLKEKLILFISLLSMLVIGCEDSKVSENNFGFNIETPITYTFSSRFVEGESSVSYSNQVVHNMLIMDIKTLTDYPASTPGYPIVMENMTQLYEYSDTYNLSSWIYTSPDVLEKFYNNISIGDNLKDKINSDIIYGLEKTADELVLLWMQKIADNCNNLDNIGTYKIITDQDGINLSQMINKTLLGAVSYSQGIKYISNLEQYDNIFKNSEDDFFSELEHAWDKSFGYFGASVDYNTGYIDDFDRINNPFFDSDTNGKIDLKSEYNFGFSLDAAKRDYGVSDLSIDFTQSIFSSFLRGRTLIHNQSGIETILVERDNIIRDWEKVIAATLIHFLNKVISDMDTLYSSDFLAGPLSEFSIEYNSNWSNMRSLVIALQYNDLKQISDSDLLIIVQAIGETPIHPIDGTIIFNNYQNTLMNTVKNIIQNTYNFSILHMEEW